MATFAVAGTGSEGGGPARRLAAYLAAAVGLLCLAVLAVEGLRPGGRLQFAGWGGCRPLAASSSSGGSGSGAAADKQPPPGAPASAIQVLTGALGSQYGGEVASRLWQYEPFLPKQSIRSGVYSLGEQTRLRRFTHKLLSGKPVSVTGVGASNMIGRNAPAGQGFMDRIHAWVREVSPNVNHTLKNAGVGGTSSGLATLCVMDMVQQDADLVFVSYAVSDPPTTDGGFASTERLTFERLLRKLLDLPQRPAVVILNTYAWIHFGGNPDTGVPAAYAGSAENDFNVLGQFYGVPLLSIRSAAYHQMAINVTGFMVKPAGTPASFFSDPIHLAGGTGHRAMTDLIVSLVRSAATSLWQDPFSAQDDQVAQEALPEPMTPGNYQRRSSTCLLQRNFEQVVVAQQGFKWKNERASATAAGEKWGWISEQPGSWCELDIDTTNHLQGNLQTNSSIVILVYLRSYEHMGRAKAECMAGCVCDPVELDGNWGQRTSQTDLLRLPVTGHDHCRVRVTLLSETASADGGHKVKLSGVMVVEGGKEAISTFWEGSHVTGFFANKGSVAVP